MWISTNIAEPSFDKQVVKVKVADFYCNYITEAYYDHNEMKWYNKEGSCLNDNVYKWDLPLFKSYWILFVRNVKCVTHVITKNMKMLKKNICKN